MEHLEKIQEELHEAAIPFRVNEPLSRHTSFQIGGPTALWIEPRNEAQMCSARAILHTYGARGAVLGAGTNILAPDEGVDACLIAAGSGLTDLQLVSGEEGKIYAGSGVKLSKAAAFAQRNSLSGLEFAHGIPGTVGGGVFMNAGAYGGEIRDVLISACVLEENGTIKELSAEELNLSYRHSMLMERGGIVLSAIFSLHTAPKEEIASEMEELMQRRKSKQPLSLPSAGSTFQRPVGAYAAALIDEAGLKGFRIGGAAVSEKHAGFVVNLGGATAADVKAVMQEVRRRVFESSGIELAPEVRFLEDILCSF